MEVVPSLNPGTKPIFFFFLDLNIQMWHVPVISPAETGIYQEVDFYFFYLNYFLIGIFTFLKDKHHLVPVIQAATQEMLISAVDILFLRGIPKDNIYVGMKGLVQSQGRRVEPAAPQGQGQG